MVLLWRHLRKVAGYETGLKVVCRLPDAEQMKCFRASSIDLQQTWPLEAERGGDALTFTVPQHAKATVILLSATGDAA